MKAVLIGDVGNHHVGDEAMLEVAVEELRRRGASEVTVVSAEPADTEQRHAVAAIKGIRFTDRSVRDDTMRDRRLAAVLALAGGRGEAHRLLADLPVQDGSRARAEAMIDVVCGADAVVVAGGGNLSSSWPEHIYERAALLGIAKLAGIPSVVTGQTLGPHLTDRQADVLGTALDRARLVGLREEASYRLATELAPNVPRRLQLDDAAVLSDEAVPAFPGNDRLTGRYVVLSLSPFEGPHADTHLEAFATLARRIRTVTAMPVVFVPNVGNPADPPRGDLVVASAIARLMRDDGFIVSPLVSARATATICRGAAAIVSSRYHPVVFGLANGVPCLAITNDRYTDTKLTGAMAHAGVNDWWLPLEAVATDTAHLVLAEFLERRDELAAHLLAATADWPERHRLHWDEIWHALTTADPIALELNRVHPRLRSQRCTVVPAAAGHAATREITRSVREATEATVRWWEHAFGEAEGYGRSLAEVLAARDDEIVGLRRRMSDLAAENAALLEAAQQAETAARSARLLVAQLGGRLDAMSASVTATTELAITATELAAVTAALEELSERQQPLERRSEVLASQLDEVFATKTFRWTRRVRVAYGRYLRIRRQLRDLNRGDGAERS